MDCCEVFSAAGKYVDQSWEYINRSQTHECGNWDWGRAIPRKGINKWGFPCSACNRNISATKSLQGNCRRWISALYATGTSSFSFFREDLPDVNLPFTQQGHSSFSFFREDLPDLDLTLTQHGHSSFTFIRKGLPDMDLAFTQQGHSSFTFFREGLPNVWTSPSHNKDTQALPSSERPAWCLDLAFSQQGHSSFTFFRGDLPQVDHVPLVPQDNHGDVLHSHNRNI